MSESSPLSPTEQPESGRPETHRPETHRPETHRPETHRPDHATAARLLAELRANGQDALAPDAARRAPLAVLPQMALARGRAHELTGPARRTLAAVAAGVAQAEGPVLWLRPAWRVEGLYPQGLLPFVPDPGALVIVRCPKPADILWAAEEALRAGCVALVVAEIASDPDLRQVRRLHLAAAEGGARAAAGRGGKDGGVVAPLALLLAHEAAQSRVAGVESRWALHPLPQPSVPPSQMRDHPWAPAPAWRLDRLLSRSEPPADWRVTLRDLRQPQWLNTRSRQPKGSAPQAPQTDAFSTL